MKSTAAQTGTQTRITSITGHTFRAGYPMPDTVQKAYDGSDLNRAIQAYKFFYPTVSFSAGYEALTGIGLRPNRGGAVMMGSPKQRVFTANSDTPYAMIPLDLNAGPVVVELPPGPLMCVVNDLNQRYVMDLGLPGPDEGTGGRHVVLPPGRAAPTGDYLTGTATTNRALLAVRALPTRGDVVHAIEMMKAVRIYGLDDDPRSTSFDWVDISDREWDCTPLGFETSLGYWQLLHRIIDAEPPFEPYRNEYGELAALGIAKGLPFPAGARAQRILERGAMIGAAEMRVQAFADRRPDRVVWPDRTWEWVSLRPENGTFDTPTYQDLEAAEKWFFQAVIESPAMFRRGAGAGSVYWLAARDDEGTYLNGTRTYRLRVPLPVPAKLFWSVTVYDAETRSQIRTDQGSAALRSLFELRDEPADGPLELCFGPGAPHGAGRRWIQTIPGRGWFAYFRLYGPEAAAFDGSWKPGDFEAVS